MLAVPISTPVGRSRADCTSCLPGLVPSVRRIDRARVCRLPIGGGRRAGRRAGCPWGFELDMPFYTWASVIVNGRVVATDYAPDAGWLVARPMRAARSRAARYCSRIHSRSSLDDRPGRLAHRWPRRTDPGLRNSGLYFAIVDKHARACAAQGTIEPPVGPELRRSREISRGSAVRSTSRRTRRHARWLSSDIPRVSDGRRTIDCAFGGRPQTAATTSGSSTSMAFAW